MTKLPGDIEATASQHKSSRDSSRNSCTRSTSVSQSNKAEQGTVLTALFVISKSLIASPYMSEQI